MTYPNDPALLTAVLRPYLAHCRYLTSAVVTVGGGPDTGEADTGEATAMATVTGEFHIPRSCYIDDTGHFNSVEFNICYNQLFYYLAAKLVQDKLLGPFDRWTMDDYWRRQLANVLISQFSSAFPRAMRGRRFSGELRIDRIVERAGGGTRQPLIILNTSCRFWDGYGRSHGEVKVAITDPDWVLPEGDPRTGTVRELAGLPVPDRRAALEAVVAVPFRTALLLPDGEPLPLDANYFDLGLTSLQANEIKQILEAQLGCPIDPAAVLGEPTVGQLVTHVIEQGLPELFPAPAPAVSRGRAGSVDVAARKPLVDELLKRMSAP
jgi:acyl carrier protein